eukprot:COSAG05_NODE_243_length_13035_cov_115.270022_3_plen_65_part_00
MGGSFVGIPPGVPLLLRADKDGVKVLVHPSMGIEMAPADAVTLDPSLGKLVRTVNEPHIYAAFY